jgi:glucokinase
MNRYIGVDFGGTNMRAAIVDVDSGEILYHRKSPTLASEGQQAVIQRIFQLIRQVTHESGIPIDAIQAVGIGVPGTPDIDSGIIEFLPNLPSRWPSVPLRAIIEQQVR